MFFSGRIHDTQRLYIYADKLQTNGTFQESVPTPSDQIDQGTCSHRTNCVLNHNYRHSFAAEYDLINVIRHEFLCVMVYLSV
jgi:hypothetical protein